MNRPRTQRSTRLSVLGLAILVGWAYLFAIEGCGGGSSTGPRVKEDGRISLQNSVDPWIIQVTYFNSELGQQISTTVSPGETKDISQAVLKGGEEVTFLLNANLPTGGYDLSEEVKLTVDGNMTIYITVVNRNAIGNPFEYEIVKR